MKLPHDPAGADDQVYKTDRWSRYQWARFLESRPGAVEQVQAGADKVYSFPRFVREVFHRMYADGDDRLASVRPEDTWAATAHSELDAMPEFERLRRRCRSDRLFAGIAATAFSEQILAKLPVLPRRLTDPEALRQQLRGLLRFAAELKTRGGNAGELKKTIESLQQQGQAAVSAAAGMAGAMDPTNLRNALRSACEAASGAVDGAARALDAFSGWGSGAGLESAGGSPQLKAELAARIASSQKLQALAREAGRLRRIAAEKQRSKASHARDEVTDIELGADLGRLLPTELVKVRHPLLRRAFARGFVEHCLLQYRLCGTETQGRGPVVVCIDQSGSMEGDREIWSKAMTLALLQVAVMQRRACRVVHFNAAVARVDDWTPGAVDPRRLLDSMAVFYGGGTSFEPPLRTALEAIESDRKLNHADVVLITDGEAELPDSFKQTWAEARQRLAFTCYAVHVDAPGGVAPASLQAVADRVVGLADVARDQAVTDTLFNL